MSIFYLEEHTSCYLYTQCTKEGFIQKNLKKGKCYEEIAEYNAILFFVDGGCILVSNEKKTDIDENFMCCVPKGSFCKICPKEDCHVVLAQFDRFIQACEKFKLAELSSLRIETPGTLYTVDIRNNLKYFLELLVRYLNDGANCFHFHEIKMKELFWLLRFYYTRQELASMFSFMVGKNYDFRRLVFNNYTKIKSVKELANACGYSLATFKRKFNKEFNESAGSWLQKQMLGMVEYKLSDESIPLKVIVDEMNFSSLAHLSRYCKQKLGYTPKEYRAQLKSGQSHKHR